MKICLVLVVLSMAAGVSFADIVRIDMRYYVGNEDTIDNWNSTLGYSVFAGERMDFYTGSIMVPNAPDNDSQDGSIAESWSRWNPTININLLPGLSGDISGNNITFKAPAAKPNFRNMSTLHPDSTLMLDSDVPGGDYVIEYFDADDVGTGSDGPGAYTTGSTITLKGQYNSTIYTWIVPVEALGQDSGNGRGDSPVDQDIVDNDPGINSTIRTAVWIGEYDYTANGGLGAYASGSYRKSGDYFDMEVGQDDAEYTKTTDSADGQDFVIALGIRDGMNIPTGGSNAETIYSGLLRAAGRNFNEIVR